MVGSLPRLEVLDRSAPPAFALPVKRIHESSDVPDFLTSLAYRDIGIFIMQLNHAVCPRHRQGTPVPLTFTLTSKELSPPSPPIAALRDVLAEIEGLIGEAPPTPGPRRFGNLSFRTWHKLLEDKAEGILKKGAVGAALDTASGDGAMKEVKSYLLGGWGSSLRLDYGTGHELSFMAFLGCLWKLGFFKTDNTEAEVEREIVFSVVEPYLVLVRKLITTYNLEPAGSHGVWGLDDHFFVSYIFGSAQLTRPIDEDEPVPLEGSVRGAPKPGDITKQLVVDDNRQTNMYFSAIGFINDIKKGPFWEHSPMLFDISGVREGWGKINKGMIKMYNAEVLSKFPVVQHFPFGSLFSWDTDPEATKPSVQAAAPTPNTSLAPGPPPAVGGTAAPWAAGSRLPPTAISTGVPAGRMPPPTQRPPAPSAPPADGSAPGGMPPTKAPWAK